MLRRTEIEMKTFFVRFQSVLMVLVCILSSSIFTGAETITIIPGAVVSKDNIAKSWSSNSFVSLIIRENSLSKILSSNALAKGQADSKYNPYDPRLLMPLEVGNKWVYGWGSSGKKQEEIFTGIDKKEAPIFYGMIYWEYKGYEKSGVSYHFSAPGHKEEYTIVRREGDHYFFTVSSSTLIGTHTEFLRDGRYDSTSLENCWTWWENTRDGETSIGLTESIKRRWEPFSDEGFSKKVGSIDTTEPLSDHRNAIRVFFKQKDSWCNTFFHVKAKFIKRMFSYDTYGFNVTVPAGTFTNCMRCVFTAPKPEYEEKELDSNELLEGHTVGDPRYPIFTVDYPKQDLKMPEWVLYQTYTFYAPGVGMVCEYQKAGGVTTYEMALLEFVPAGKSDAKP